MVNHEFPPIGGGAATANYFLAKSLLSQGHVVCVLTSAIDDLPFRTVEEGVEVVRLRTLRKLKDRAGILEMTSFSIMGLLGLPSVVGKFRPDCAIVMFTIPCGHIGLALNKIWNIPYVISLRGGDSAVRRRRGQRRGRPRGRAGGVWGGCAYGSFPAYTLLGAKWVNGG